MKGVDVLRISYLADPEKQDPRWAESMKAGYPADQWQREFEMNAHAGLGLSIYGREYDPAVHERPLLIDPRLPVIHGWDFGEGWPAHVWLQRTMENGVRVLASAWREHMQLRPFAEQVVGYEVNLLGGPYANRRDFCDPSGNQHKDDGLKSVEVLRAFGWLPKWRGSEHTERHEYVSGLLTRRQLDGEPMVLVDPARNPQLCEALRSRYRRDPQGHPVREHPFIDLVDAWHYALINQKTPPRPRPAPADLSFLNPVSGYGRPPLVAR